MIEKGKDLLYPFNLLSKLGINHPSIATINTIDMIISTYLTKEQRTVLREKYGKRITYNEVAKNLNLPIHIVSKHMQRSLYILSIKMNMIKDTDLFIQYVNLKNIYNKCLSDRCSDFDRNSLEQHRATFPIQKMMINDLDLSISTINALHRNNIRYLTEIIYLSPKELSNLKTINKVAVEDIVNNLKVFGYFYDKRSVS